MYVELQLLWEGLLWFPWSWRSTQTSYARFRTQTGHWQNGTKCSKMMIYLARWNKKQTNKDGRLLSFLFRHLWPSHVVSEFNWKKVLSKITSRISKPLSVFDKLGFGSNFEFRSKPSLITVICMDPHSPNKLFETKYCFLILGNDSSCFSLIISLFFVFFCYFMLFCYY